MHCHSMLGKNETANKIQMTVILLRDTQTYCSCLFLLKKERYSLNFLINCIFVQNQFAVTELLQNK